MLLILICLASSPHPDQARAKYLKQSRVYHTYVPDQADCKMKQNNMVNTEEVLSYLNLKKDHCEKILCQAQSLEEVIKAGNVEKLNLIITEKTNYTKDIKRLDRLNNKCQEEIKYNHENLISDKRFVKLEKQLQFIITKITHYDQKCKILLSSSIKDTKDKFEALNEKRQGLQSMRTQETHLPSFVDVIS